MKLVWHWLFVWLEWGWGVMTRIVLNFVGLGVTVILVLFVGMFKFSQLCVTKVRNCVKLS